jgi:hypothetical protein
MNGHWARSLSRKSGLTGAPSNILSPLLVRARACLYRGLAYKVVDLLEL